MADSVRQVGGGPPPQRPERSRSRPRTSEQDQQSTEAPQAERLSGRRQLAEDTIEISSQGQRELQQLQETREREQDRLDRNDLEFTGRRFYTIGLNIIREERIQPPSEPEIKE